MEHPKRKPNRLPNYDYSQSGAYFITICVQDRKSILSRIPVGEGLAPPEPVLSPFGKIAQAQLTDLQNRYRNVSIDRYVIMPNHIHILMRINPAGGGKPLPYDGIGSCMCLQIVDDQRMQKGFIHKETVSAFFLRSRHSG